MEMVFSRITVRSVIPCLTSLLFAIRRARHKQGRNGGYARCVTDAGQSYSHHRPSVVPLLLWPASMQFHLSMRYKNGFPPNKYYIPNHPASQCAFRENIRTAAVPGDPSSLRIRAGRRCESLCAAFARHLPIKLSPVHCQLFIINKDNGCPFREASVVGMGLFTVPRSPARPWGRPSRRCRRRCTCWLSPRPRAGGTHGRGRPPRTCRSRRRASC